MKHNAFCLLLFLTTGTCIHAQQRSAENHAIDIAKNDFSKTKFMRKEKFGVVKEKHKVIESTPVVERNPEFYSGNYWYESLQYKLEIRTDEQHKLMATLSIPGQPDIRLKNVTVTDAYFIGFKPNQDGTEEKWEGVFINKTDDSHTTFGLGIKLATPIALTQGLKITKLFFAKVSP
ncbi:hypothetical protein GO755_27995 [Spirosoma sp. HMF4905]|uniref:Uncharacterized protein n=1 Tax=Spirosoma arboris TaxID=2682092 RepID=A0A7K1SJC0_9BACT|nr:hypothetical protein [Spirosoma arboris]MVM33911.1 hypothetical protein [Spirosoma arboris]